MTRIAPIKTAQSSKALWFDAEDFEIEVGQHVVVETARGIEFGTLASKIFEADKKQLKSLRSELKPVKRIATDDDIERASKLEEKGKNSLPRFKELASTTNEDMCPISIEYLLDGKKAVFYFSAPERQDFRDLVKKLSSEFHIRVDMHQINERDKAALVSGIGMCGQELCCAKLGKCPRHVSIKMAKTQGLSLNPENISGLCGKLLCCLDYEFKDYDDFTKRAPKLKAKIDTPDGTAVVTDINMPNETVEVKLEESEKRVRIPLADMIRDKSRQGNRPNKINKEKWESALQNKNVENLEAVYINANLEGDEKLASGNVTTLPSQKKKQQPKQKKKSYRNYKPNTAPKKRRRSRVIETGNND